MGSFLEWLMGGPGRLAALTAIVFFLVGYFAGGMIVLHEERNAPKPKSEEK